MAQELNIQKTKKKKKRNFYAESVRQNERIKKVFPLEITEVFIRPLNLNSKALRQTRYL